MQLRPLLKASSMIGLIVGGIGSWTIVFVLTQALLFEYLSGAGFLPEISLALTVILVVLFLFGGPLAFGSALCLVVLPLTDDQKDVFGFLALMGSITALAVFPVLWALSAGG